MLIFAAVTHHSLELGIEDLTFFGSVVAPAVFLEFAIFVLLILFGICGVLRFLGEITLLEPIWEGFGLGFGRSYDDRFSESTVSS